MLTDLEIAALRQRAAEEAHHFITQEQDYRMSYIEAEKPHPHTRRLSQTYAENVVNGVKLILETDQQMAQRAVQSLGSAEYTAFADAIRKTIVQGGRVIFSGCGSSGRLSMGLERAWRKGIQELLRKYTNLAEALESYQESVGNIMTGGDYAVIRAAESFEDSTAMGKYQTKLLGLCEKDLVIGVTATGETTSILGTVYQAMEQGVPVYMLICADPTPLPSKMARCRDVYTHPGCRVLSLPCGPMALTGSTRMQSSSFEQLAAAIALEGAMWDILEKHGIPNAFQGYNWYAQQFLSSVEQLLSEKSLQQLAKATLLEQGVYESGGLMTLYADRFLMDVLTDTTERSPTFMTPPFCSSDMVNQPQSWAFVKNPDCDTEEAWNRCFLRKPRCIEWDTEVYRSLGFSEKQISAIPDITYRAIQRFHIGRESLPQRENAPNSYALWVDVSAAPESFHRCAAAYQSAGQLTLEAAGITLPQTNMEIYEHLCLKMMLNTLSTGVMARMGRIHGNWMTCMAISNKKLMDRGARIVSDLCGVPYEQALAENFYSRLESDAMGLHRSPVQETIRRLGMK